MQSTLQRRLEQANEMLQYERNARDALQTEKDAVDSELRRTYAQSSNERLKLERDLKDAKDHVNRLLDGTDPPQTIAHRTQHHRTHRRLTSSLQSLSSMQRGLGWSRRCTSWTWWRRG